jgi:hypothetical protein
VRHLRALTGAVLLVAAALGFAAPAQAEQAILGGKYTYVQDGGKTGTWAIWPSCVPVVGDLRTPLYLPVGCRLHVETTGDSVVGGDAVLVNGIWGYTRQVRDGMTCPDGSIAPTREQVSFNTDTMSGTRKTFYNEQCGLQPGVVTTNFTLAFKEQLPIPVDLYPLICEPGGLKRCF